MDTNINYGSLLSDYKCVFEGKSDPIFYGTLYPTNYSKNSYHMDNLYKILDNEEFKVRKERILDQINSNFSYIHGLKYKGNDDDDPYKTKEKAHDQHQLDYLSVAHNLLSTISKISNYKWGIMTIPSSTVGFKNVITKLMKFALTSTFFDDSLVDLTDNLYRAKTKETAHEGGTRDQESNISTLGLKKDAKLQSVDALLIVDDVTTSGNSMAAVKKFLSQNGINLPIINFAFGHSVLPETIPYYMYPDKGKGYAVSGSFHRIIFDLDQTLIDSNIRNEQFEKEIIEYKGLKFGKDKGEKLRTIIRDYPEPYNLYADIEKLINSDNDFAVVSNSVKDRMNIISQTDVVEKVLYPEIWESHFTRTFNKDVDDAAYYKYYSEHIDDSIMKTKLETFRTSFDTFNNLFSYSDTPKPMPDNVKRAINWLLQDKSDSENTNTNEHEVTAPIDEKSLSPKDIIGVGNTQEDIIAYHYSGIPAVLALWGVPNIFKSYAKKNWGADFVFDTFSEFNDFIKKHNSDISSIDISNVDPPF